MTTSSDCKPIYFADISFGLDSSVTSQFHCEEGCIIFNRFRLIRILGSGGFGCVWEATDTWLGNHHIALKINKNIANQAIPSFITEVKLTRMLPKDRFVSVYDFVKDENAGLMAYSMELLTDPWYCLYDYWNAFLFKNINNASLSDQISVAKNVICTIIELLRSVAILHGPKYARQNRWCHGDIKPQNVYINNEEAIKAFKASWPANPSAFIKIGDLGLACRAGETLNAGTYNFRAPEQAPDSYTPVSAKSDIYAVGKTFYFLLTGNVYGNARPHPAAISRSLYRFIPSNYLSDYLGSIISRMLNTHPAARPSAEEAIDLLNRILVSEEEWIIISKLSMTAKGVQLSKAVEIAFPEIAKMYNWANQTQRRLHKIQKTIRSLKNKNVLFLDGRKYKLR